MFGKLEGSVFLARVMLDGDNLDFVDLDKLRTFCSDDFFPRRNSNSSASDQAGDKIDIHIHRDERESLSVSANRFSSIHALS